MEYKEIEEKLDNDKGNLDGKVSIEEAVKVISNFTGIEEDTFQKCLINHSLIEIFENPSLLNISLDQEKTLSELKVVLDYSTEVLD